MNSKDQSKTPGRRELVIRRRDNTPSEQSDVDSRSPFEREIHADPHGPSALQAAWDKLYRARSILEAEQTHLRDDRIAIQGAIEELERREVAVRAREERIRVAELQAELSRQEAEDARAEESAISRITRAPFAMAKSVFTPRK